MAFGGKTIVHADLETLPGAVPGTRRAMIQAITAQESAAALRVLAQLLDQGKICEPTARDGGVCAQHAGGVGRASSQEWQGLIQASAEDLTQMASATCSFSPELLQELLAIFRPAEDSLRLSAHPRFVLETAAVQATRLLRRQDGRSVQQTVPHAQLARPSQSAPIPIEKPGSAGRSENSAPAPLPKSSQAPTSAPIASMTPRLSAVEMQSLHKAPRQIIRMSLPVR